MPRRMHNIRWSAIGRSATLLLLASLFAVALLFGGGSPIKPANQADADGPGEVRKLTASDAQDNDHFGGSVAVSGDTAIVGAREEDGTGTGRGAAYVFQRDVGDPSNWIQVKKLTASDTEDYDHFGWSVAVSGDITIVGAQDQPARTCPLGLTTTMIRKTEL